MTKTDEHRLRDNATEGQPGTDTKRGCERISAIMGANKTETERTQTEMQLDRRTARQRHKKKGSAKFTHIRSANMTETERAQTGRQRDRRTARHRHKERV